MNARSLRRLAADHGMLHSQPLPPNFLFSPDSPDNDDLTQLDVLLAGPTHTPFAAGVFRLHLIIPATYPQQPPTAHFRTPIFHPNVDPQTGGVCVETLKRDWDAKLTLRDILVVIQCLLIQPNPDSALNAEAGALLQDDFGSFQRRAELMTSIHAVVPRAWKEAVSEAQNRGREVEESVTVRDVMGEEPTQARDQAERAAPTRRRVPTARQRGTAKSRKIDGSPSGTSRVQRQQHSGSSNPFMSLSGEEDVFSDPHPLLPQPTTREQSSSIGIFEDDSMTDVNQENDESKSPSKPIATRHATPLRPHGTPVPLGELTMEEACETDDSSDMEPEYPPSPRKSPTKSVLRKQRQQAPALERAESSRDAARRNLNITPPNLTAHPLAQDSPFASFATDYISTPSPRKPRNQPARTPPGSNRTTAQSGVPFGLLTPRHGAGVVKTRSPSSSEKKRQHEQRRVELEARLWKSCGEDIRRWNRGDFDGEPFVVKGGRW